jgi:hypothetical protein
VQPDLRCMAPYDFTIKIHWRATNLPYAPVYAIVQIRGPPRAMMA